MKYLFLFLLVGCSFPHKNNPYLDAMIESDVLSKNKSKKIYVFEENYFPKNISTYKQYEIINIKEGYEMDILPLDSTFGVYKVYPIFFQGSKMVIQVRGYGVTTTLDSTFDSTKNMLYLNYKTISERGGGRNFEVRPRRLPFFRRYKLKFMEGLDVI